MKHIYLYGHSDDCMEVDSDFGSFESYVGITLNDVRAYYVFDGDWGIWLEGDIPASWKVKSIQSNTANEARDKPYGGSVIHIQVPDDEQVLITELSNEDN